ncbi:MAG: polyphosphate kinase, partial [Oceanospirillaceae bacterium]
MKTKADHFDRELSWLSFNQRVLQEAQNPDVPLMDRLRYLAIFSSNLEEF